MARRDLSSDYPRRVGDPGVTRRGMGAGMPGLSHHVPQKTANIGHEKIGGMAPIFGSAV
jgi:hypothetical protein